MVQPFLKSHCLACHNGQLKTANLNFDDYPDSKAAIGQTEIWEKVLDKLSAGKMPPPGRPAPGAREIEAVSGWIEGVLKRSGFPRSDPGRVTARRLNRVEYNNTIRDLLGVHLRPADDFPTDDSGYGFDNIGDVLSLSPMLMEKYLASAKTISRVAVGLDPIPPKPILLTRLMAKRSQESGRSLGHSTILPYSMRGALYGSYVFPADAEYELRFRTVNFRGQDPSDLPEQLREQRRRRGQAGQGRIRPTPEELKAFDDLLRKAFPPVKVVLTLDSKVIKEHLVEGHADTDYERGEVVARVPVKAGEHRLRVSFPELASLNDPRNNLNPDMRRKLFVDYLSIVGPFSPSSEPSESYKRVFICGHVKGGHQADCGRKIVSNLARRAYRRPVTGVEIDGLLRLVRLAEGEGESLEEGIRLALQAILVSPHFLFRIELDPNPSDPSTGHYISEHELASRLSYFLWSSMPDEELMQAAEEGRLRQPGVLERQVRRMLADARASALVTNFAAQWLGLRNLDRIRPDSHRFPSVDDELIDAMREETYRFVEYIIREDRSILDFVDSPVTFLNGPLARHYGISGVEGEELRRVKLDGERRSGILTQAAILSVSSYPTRTSPVLRGKWVLENLLGAPPPPPPPDIPELEEDKIGSTSSLRQQLEQHRAKPACAVCHVQMDAIGFGLESYDAAGAWRTHDGKFPIDSTGTLPDGKSFRGPKELKEILKAQPAVIARNFTGKLLTYALGRGLERYDSREVARISRRLAENDHRFSTLVLEIVNGAPFQMRRGDSGGKR